MWPGCRDNAVLKRLALPAIDAAVRDALNNGAPGAEPRTWVRESSYRAGSWSRSRRVNAFACNQVRLLLAGFGHQIMHVQRAVLERMTGTGWSLRRLAERVLRTPARFTVSGHYVTVTTGGASAHWRMLARGLAASRPCAGPPDSGAAASRRPLSRPRRPRGRQGVSRRRKTAPFGPGEPPFRPLNRPESPPRPPSGGLREAPQTLTLPRHVSSNKAGSLKKGTEDDRNHGENLGIS